MTSFLYSTNTLYQDTRIINDTQDQVQQIQNTIQNNMSILAQGSINGQILTDVQKAQLQQADANYQITITNDEQTIQDLTARKGSLQKNIADATKSIFGAGSGQQ